MKSLIKVEHFSYAYIHQGSSIPILQDVSLNVEEGECVALMGASGAGKSTLLALIGLLLRQQKGQLWLDQHPCHDLNERSATLLRRKLLGFIYQFHHLCADFSAIENVMIPLQLQNREKNHACALAQEMLERVGLGSRLHHSPSQLSGGERQRVAIARALVHRPRIVLADEPTGNLDEATGNYVFEAFLKVARESKSCLLVATHSPALAAKCDRVLYLKQGRIHVLRPSVS